MKQAIHWVFFITYYLAQFVLLFFIRSFASASSSFDGRFSATVYGSLVDDLIRWPIGGSGADVRGKHCRPSLDYPAIVALFSSNEEDTHIVILHVFEWVCLMIVWCCGHHICVLSLFSFSISHRPSSMSAVIIIDIDIGFLCLYGIDSICPLCPSPSLFHSSFFFSTIVVFVRMASNNCSFFIYFSISASY